MFPLASFARPRRLFEGEKALGVPVRDEFLFGSAERSVFDEWQRTLIAYERAIHGMDNPVCAKHFNAELQLRVIKYAAWRNIHILP